MNLEDVYEYYGTVIKAAEAVNVSRQTFHTWMRKGLIPYNQQQRYEKLTDGKLLAVKHPEPSPRKSAYSPSFRYYSDVLGMCEVHSLTYFSDREPRIRYYNPVNRQLTFSSFDTTHLMQSTIFIDRTGKRIFEKDVVMIDGRPFTMELWIPELLEKIMSAKDVLIIGNKFEGIDK